MSLSRWIDISRPLHAGTAVWPGDHRFAPSAKWHLRRGDSVTVHTLTLSVHTGSHADAPSHVSRRGATIDRVALDAYLGPAYLLVLNETPPLTAAILGPALRKGAKRILVKTPVSRLSERAFPRKYSYVTPDGADTLARARVVLIGLDSPSVDPFDSKTLEGHHHLFRKGIAVLENLWLTSLQEGWYDLCALPLRLQNLDASPVRAVAKRRSGPVKP